MKKIILKISLGFVVVLVVITTTTVGYIFSFYSDNGIVEKKDCAVVFGAAVWPGGVPSHALSDRTNAAIDLYYIRKVDCLVFSGADSVFGKHEVDVMLDIAYERSVDLADVEVDYYGNNTRDTIRNLNNLRSYIFVSNDFHLARINLLARQYGLENYDVYKSQYIFGRYKKEPYLILRETVAFWYYVFNK